jgi:hypothetical protein
MIFLSRNEVAADDRLNFQPKLNQNIPLTHGFLMISISLPKKIYKNSHKHFSTKAKREVYSN